MQPDSIREYSAAPYALTFKENGCIIFISSLSPEQLIVTSKHSLGGREDVVVSHAQKGEEWLGKHLGSVGLTKRGLARELWDRKETAVAELCDDDFEEHVLAYPPERRGLHLHGLNANAVHFKTRPMTDVDDFARTWGFIPTRWLEMRTLDEVDQFTSKVAETGSWQGTAIEGFVVRTSMPKEIDTMKKKMNGVVAPPYASGQTWFYKVKFDEPYLMYRDWRELTKRMLKDKNDWEAKNGNFETIKQSEGASTANSAEEVVGSQPKSKNAQKKEARKLSRQQQSARQETDKTRFAIPEPPQTRSKRPETKLYVQWCHSKMYGQNADLSLFATFNENKGIIALRERFIKYMSTQEGRLKLDAISGGTKKKSAGTESSSSLDAERKGRISSLPFDKTLLVPVAVPGCGKTALAVALQHLFDIGHTQSDDVQTKKTAPAFLKNINAELQKQDVVFADRNNHLLKHRDEIVQSVQEWQQRSGHRVRLVALAWSLDALPLNAIHRICSDRLVARGENHQILRVEKDKKTREHEVILWRFLKDLKAFRSAEKGAGNEGYGDEAFDETITLDVNAPLDETIQSAARKISTILGKPLPHDDQLKVAVEKATEYRVTLKKEAKTTTKTNPIRYYAIAVEANISDTLNPLLMECEGAKAALMSLEALNRVVERPHVTLVHNSALQREGEEGQTARARWDLFEGSCSQEAPVEFELKIDCLAWDEKAMAMGVSDAYPIKGNLERNVFDAVQARNGSWRPHITVGTFHEDIRPYEANRVLLDADAGKASVGRLAFPRGALIVRGRLAGLN